MAQIIHKGGLLATALDHLNFPKRYIGRLALAQKSSFLIPCLGQVSQEESYRQKTFKHLKQLLCYPLILLIIVSLIIFFVRWLLLPQLLNLITADIRQKHLLINILLFSLEELPLISGISLLFALITANLVFLYYRSLSTLSQLKWLHRLPIVGKLEEDYLSWQFTLELSSLLEQGISIKEALDQLLEPSVRPSIRSISHLLIQYSIKGIPISQSLQSLPFLRQDLALVIQKGDILSQRATKLRLLADKYFSDFTQKCKRLIMFVQPLLFSIVALLIMGIYLILLMPMLTMLDQAM